MINQEADPIVILPERTRMVMLVYRLEYCTGTTSCIRIRPIKKFFIRTLPVLINFVPILRVPVADSRVAVL
jgi:hypothetical protein